MEGPPEGGLAVPRPNKTKTPIFRGSPNPPQVDPYFFFTFPLYLHMFNDLRNCFNFFSNPNIKIQWLSLEY